MELRVTTIEQPRIRDALAQVRGELEAISDDSLEIINVDPLGSVALARGALPKILAFRGEIAITLPLFNLNNIDRLETYALALMAAQSYYCAARGLEKERAQLAAEANQLRKQLLLDFTFLSSRGLLMRANALELKGSNGHLNIAADVMTIATVLRENWNQVAGYCACTTADLDQAEILSDGLTRAVGNREPVPAEVMEATRQRQRAYTLFIRAYAEVRAAIVYIRRNAFDADRIAPTLYGKRKRPAKQAEPTTSLSPDVNPVSVAEAPAPAPVPAEGAPPTDVNVDPFVN